MSPKERSADKDPDATGAVPAGGIEAEKEGTGSTQPPKKTDATAKGAPAGGDPPAEQEALRAEIEETRAELGETVEALSAKADVKGQVKEKVEERKAQLRDQQAQAQAKLRDQQAQAKAKLGEVSEQAKSNPAPFAAAAGGVLALLLVIRRFRRR